MSIGEEIKKQNVFLTFPNPLEYPRLFKGKPRVGNLSEIAGPRLFLWREINFAITSRVLFVRIKLWLKYLQTEKWRACF